MFHRLFRDLCLQESAVGHHLKHGSLSTYYRVEWHSSLFRTLDDARLHECVDEPSPSPRNMLSIHTIGSSSYCVGSTSIGAPFDPTAMKQGILLGCACSNHTASICECSGTLGVALEGRRRLHPTHTEGNGEPLLVLPTCSTAAKGPL